MAKKYYLYDEKILYEHDTISHSLKTSINFHLRDLNNFLTDYHLNIEQLCLHVRLSNGKIREIDVLPRKSYYSFFSGIHRRGSFHVIVIMLPLCRF